jgi:para-nitrobenzyl esterase
MLNKLLGPEGPAITRRTFLGGSGALVVSTLLSKRAFGQEASPVVKTSAGKVRGLRAMGVLSFRGIPYGGGVSGAGRFLPPKPPKRWSGIREVTQAGPRAIQAPGSLFESPEIGAYFCGGRKDCLSLTNQADSEECLDLNVLTPGVSGRRPVMVYMHGGGFTGGSAALTLLADRFVAENDLVLVGVNHRLNVFGYTYLGGLDPKYADSGNIGQLDLIAALEWVRKNIAHFGGDPNNVTIFGESGGGGKVSALVAMPKAKGLFRNAIVQSGSLREARTTEEATEATKKLFEALNLTSADTAAFAALPASKLLETYTKTASGFGGPVVDNRSLFRQPWKDGAPAEAAGLNMIIGNCKDESTLFSLRGTTQALFDLDWNSLQSTLVQRGVAEIAVKDVIQAYQKDFPAASPSDLYFRIQADRGARRNAIAQAEAKAAQNAGSVYMYYFAWNTPLLDGKLRAFHTSDLPLEMRLVLNPEAEPLSMQLAGAWAAFARTGSPNGKNLPQWPAYSLKNRATMVYDLPSGRAVDHPEQRELDLLAAYPGGFL